MLTATSEALLGLIAVAALAGWLRCCKSYRAEKHDASRQFLANPRVVSSRARYLDRVLHAVCMMMLKARCHGLGRCIPLDLGNSRR
jgi:hypothetical protein